MAVDYRQGTDAVKSRSLKWHVFYNIGVWLVMCLCAFVTLSLARQYGSDFSARHTARQLIDRAEVLYAQGSIFECEQALTQALNTHVTTAEILVSQFGRRLVGLPQTTQRLRELLSTNMHRTHARSRGMFAVLEGDLERAQQLLSEVVQSGRNSPEVSLWLARLALESDDMIFAKDHFDQYWAATDASRDQVGIQIVNEASSALNPYFVARNLFEQGLWKEAFARFDKLKAGSNMPGDLGYYQGLALELEGKRQEAIRAYTAVLAALPNHRLTLKRLKKLLSEID